MKEYNVTISEDTVPNLLNGAALLARALNDDILCNTFSGIVKNEKTILQPHVPAEYEAAYNWLCRNYDVIANAAVLLSETLTMVDHWIAGDEIRTVGNER